MLPLITYIFATRKNKILLLCFLFFIFNSAFNPVKAQKFKIELQNQVSGWGITNFNKPLEYQFGGRYIPSLSISNEFKNKHIFDTEISLNAYGNFGFTGDNYDGFDKKIKPYRMWARYSTNHFELRVGLQKINFGSATIFRPLMWFDKMDFRDPLQLTDGVYGLLGRYYLSDNLNFWLWALRGNDKAKGWETMGTKKDRNEYGGRMQLPLWRGEIAISYHNRIADYSPLYAQMPPGTKSWFPEELYAFDAKFDLGVGLWVEYVYKNNDSNNKFVSGYENYFNSGMDYTFALGNGINVTTEYFKYKTNGSGNIPAIENNYTVLAINYPFGLLNTISGVVYYNIDKKEWSRFINIQRKYDFWSYYLMAFWNPKNNAGNASTLFAGKGIQLMAVVNF